MAWSNNGKEKISLFESFVSRIMELEEKLNMYLDAISDPVISKLERTLIEKYKDHE